MTNTERLPLNTLAIAFGLVGLANVWTVAGTDLDLPPMIGGILSVVAATTWLTLIVAHIVRGSQSGKSLLSQLKHPVQGPIAALGPIVGMLLGASLFHVAPTAGRAVVLVFMVVTAVFAGWIVAAWLVGSIPMDSIHGGYYLPTVAGGLIAATAAAETGMDALAMGAFAVGAFMWVVVTAAILTRLMFAPPLPDQLFPTLAIFVAPPAVAGTAWFLITGGVDPIDYALAGLTSFMVLVQLALIPRYRQVSFSLGFWSFTFSFAAVGGYGIEWLALLHPDGWQLAVISIASGIPVLVLSIAVRSLGLHDRDTQPRDLVSTDLQTKERP